MLKDLIGPVDFNYCGSIISHNSGTNLTSSDSYFLIVRVLSSNRKLNDNARAVTAASIDQDHPSSSASALQAITFSAEAQNIRNTATIFSSIECVQVIGVIVSQCVEDCLMRKILF